MSARAQRRPPPESVPDRVCLGRIVGAKGLKGEVRVRAFTARARDIAAYGPVADESGARRFAVSVVAETEGGAIVRLSGIGDRTAAEKLKGLSLYVPRAALPPLPAGEYYQGDLIGLAAEDENGNPLGRVRAIHDFGAGAILEIDSDLRPAGSVVAVDLTRGKVVLAAATELVAKPQADHARPKGGRARA
jgi:16S rRNA processing protein RimM